MPCTEMISNNQAAVFCVMRNGLGAPLSETDQPLDGTGMHPGGGLSFSSLHQLNAPGIMQRHVLHRNDLKQPGGSVLCRAQ